MRELMTDVRDILATAAGTSDKIDALFAGQSRVESQLADLARAIQRRAPPVAQAIPSATGIDPQDILGEIEATYAELSWKLDAIAADARQAAENTAGVPEMARRVSNIQVRLNELQSGRRNPTGVPNNLPDPSPHFAAREAKLVALHERLRKADTVAVGQQVALWADGGVGKTMLAEHYAWAYLAQYPGGVFKISGEVPQLRTELASLAPALKIQSTERAPDDVAGESKPPWRPPTVC